MEPGSQKNVQGGNGAQVLEPSIPENPVHKPKDSTDPALREELYPNDSKILVALLQLESQIRRAQTLKELCFLLANEPRRLVPFRQACVFSMRPFGGRTANLEAVSSLAIIDRQAPMVSWIEQVLTVFGKKSILHEPCQLTSAQCPEDLHADWKRFAFPFVLWCPLVGTTNQLVGGVWLGREKAWVEAEIQVVRRLAETAAHSWQALGGKRKAHNFWSMSKGWVWGVLALIVGALCIPVPLSTLAPVEVIAHDPAVIAAPLDGVISEILVEPNTVVRSGATLFRYEDTTFRNQYEVAEKDLAVGLMEYHKVAQGAFLDEETGANMPVQASEVQLKEAQRDYAFEVLDKVEVKAPRTGIVLFEEKSKWIGKPVVVGERIMEVANPKDYELKIDLPVDDAIVLREGAEVEVFLNAHPLKAIPATLTHASYQAQVLPTEILAYRVKAQFTESPGSIRIGWQGTAKIYGDRVSLFFFLFRRPLTFFRQTLGW